MKYLIANWKLHKTVHEAKQWLTDFQTGLHDKATIRNKLENKELAVVICPPYPLFLAIKDEVDKLPNVFLGSQDISAHPEGSYTGEVGGATLQELIQFSLIGHSERRKYLNESDSIIGLKSEQALQHKITPIVCVRNAGDAIPVGVKIVAYEPLESIGTGKNASVASVRSVFTEIAAKGNFTYLYGGSVDPQNAEEYLQMPEISGFLVGTSSLDPFTFLNLAACF